MRQKYAPCVELLGARLVFWMLAHSSILFTDSQKQYYTKTKIWVMTYIFSSKFAVTAVTCDSWDGIQHGYCVQ